MVARPKLTVVSLLWVLAVSGTSVQVSDYTDRCMKLITKYYKPKAGPEPTLECTRYRKKSCCKAGASLPFQAEQQWQNITNYNQCPAKKPRLSAACQKQFFDEICFFLCSPNVGPWIDKATHDEPVTDRFRHVPICASTCNAWWDACKNEYTCTDNWYIGFNTTGPGIHRCRSDAACKTYTEYFKNATNFCQKIWDNSFKVYPDSQPCMKFNFDATKSNPNVGVALRKAKELVRVNDATGRWTIPAAFVIVCIAGTLTQAGNW